MDNHFQLLLQLPEPGALSTLLAGLLVSYWHHYRRRYGLVGHLFQGRCKSPAVETDGCVLSCGRYIERNPLAARLVGLPWEYRWSSSRAYALGELNGLLAENRWYLELAAEATRRQQLWRSFLVEADPKEEDVERQDVDNARILRRSTNEIISFGSFSEITRRNHPHGHAGERAGRLPWSALGPVLDRADFPGYDPHLLAIRQPQRKPLSRRFRFLLRGESKLRIVRTEQDGRPLQDQRLTALLQRRRVASANSRENLKRQHAGRVRFRRRQAAGKGDPIAVFPTLRLFISSKDGGRPILERHVVPFIPDDVHAQFAGRELLLLDHRLS
jgi:hypothetical protein